MGCGMRNAEEILRGRKTDIALYTVGGRSQSCWYGGIY